MSKNIMYNRWSKVSIAVVICWGLLPFILLFVLIICLLLPVVALFKPEIIKIKNK